jgi:hypothetical protein
MGLRTAGMLGFDGGLVKSLLDTVMLIPDFTYGYVEDVHMVIDHLITGYFSLQFADSSRKKVRLIMRRGKVSAKTDA